MDIEQNKPAHKNKLTKRRFSLYWTGLVGIIGFALLAGCEDNGEPDDYNTADPISALSVNPSSKILYAGDDHAIFSAEGGSSPYSWSISDTSLGSIPSTTASTITYTRSGTTVGANVITLIDSNGWSAEAIVTQKSTVAP